MWIKLAGGAHDTLCGRPRPTLHTGYVESPSGARRRRIHLFGTRFVQDDQLEPRGGHGMKKFDSVAIRKTILDMAFAGSTVHIGCAFSIVELLAVLYRNHLHFDAADPDS